MHTTEQRREIFKSCEKDMTEKDKMVAQEIKERGAVAIIRHKIK